MGQIAIISIALVAQMALFQNNLMAQADLQVYVVGSKNWSDESIDAQGNVHYAVPIIARKILERANVPYTFESLPWARAFQLGLKKKNVLVVGIARTVKREDLFLWVGQITESVPVYFFKLKSNPMTLNSLDEVKEYTVMTERATNYQEFLEFKGFTNIELVSEPRVAVKMLEKKRHPLIILKEVQFLELVDALEIDPALFEKALFAFDASEYLAFNKDTSPMLVERLRSSYESLLKEGQISRALNR